MPHIDYKNKNGDNIPGVTEVIDILNKPYLIKWANSLGYRGINYEKTLKKAADIGSEVHAVIDRYIRKSIKGKNNKKLLSFKRLNKDLNIIDEKKIKNCFNAFKDWEFDFEPEYIVTECNMVSDRYNYGGTFDLICKIGDSIYLVDFKTSNSMSETMFIQLAGYIILIEENGVVDNIDKVAILQLNKEGNSYKFYTLDIDELEKYKLLFLQLLHTYFMYGEVKRIKPNRIEV